MKITKEIIKRIRTHKRERVELISELAKAFNTNLRTPERWIHDNEPDGNLTKEKSVRIICEVLAVEKETVLTEEQISIEK